MTDEEEVELNNFVNNSFNEKRAMILMDAIKWKFPRIRNLEINKSTNGYSVVFENNFIYTKKEIEDFLTELKSFSIHGKIDNHYSKTHKNGRSN